ncbi:MAG: hypothetical protein K8H75_08275 [Sulfuricella sp.]|nr:hypothetical protein [Sulfuricella sp.]
MRNHIIHVCIATLISLVGFFSFNWLIDPYNIWDGPKIHGVNTIKSELSRHQRIYKIVGLSKRHSSIVILGSSRSDNGLNPNHEALGTDALNMGISDQPNIETHKIFDLLADRKIAHTFIIGLDFFEANALKPYPADFDVMNFEPVRNLQLLASASVLWDSVLTIANRKVLLSNTWSEKGLRLYSDEYVIRGGGHRKLMSSSEKEYLTHNYLPLPSCSFVFSAAAGNPPPLEEIRAIFSRAHSDHIVLKLFISPSHARQWETLAAASLWNKWEEWKHKLVQMNEEEARRAGQPSFALWDFSGYNSITTENVPALGDTKTIMHWHFDSSHYTPAAGDLVLDRIFNFKSPDRTVPDDFGVLLTSSNIDAHLASIRVAREHYRLTHPADVAEIEGMALDVAKTKRCKLVKK